MTIIEIENYLSNRNLILDEEIYNIIDNLRLNAISEKMKMKQTIYGACGKYLLFKKIFCLLLDLYKMKNIKMRGYHLILLI